MPTEQALTDTGFAIIPDLLDQSQVRLVSEAMEASLAIDAMRKRNDNVVTEADDEYSPPIGEMLMRHCRKTIETEIDRELVEAYAYWRIYHAGALLLRHRDREACEISVSIPISVEPSGSDWPLMIEDLNGQRRSIELSPGSAIVYLGQKIEHWRETFGGERQKQLLFHYVLKDGDSSDHALDGREELSFRWVSVS